MTALSTYAEMKILDHLFKNTSYTSPNAYIGAFNIDNVEIGTMTWSDVRIGDDGNIDTADFVVNNSVNVNTLLDGVVEKPIEIR